MTYKKTTLYLKTETERKLEEIQSLASLPTRNVAIEKAVEFYYGYLTGNISQDYLCEVLGGKLEGLINRSDDRTARLLFKMAVELNMLTRMLAPMTQMSADSYSRLRRKAVGDVKASRGILSVYDAANDGGGGDAG